MSKVKFGDVVREVKHNIDRNNNPYDYYIAGDHMDTADLTIHRKGSFATDDVGPAFIRELKKGQILYGSRRTYLKKVAVADFDGVTANTTFVLETKDPSVFLQSLLPFVMLSERFTDWSIKHSKGSTNPYVLFSDLSNFEFDLPDIEKQNELSDLLWACFRLQERYYDLIKQSDELVKSQFVEVSRGWDVEREPLSNYITNITYGFTNPMPDADEGPWKVTAKDIVNGEIDFTTARKTCLKDYELLTDKSRPVVGDVLLTKDGTLGRVAVVKQENICINQSVAAIRCNSRILPDFLANLLQMPEYQEEMLANAGGVTVRHLYITRVDKMMMLVPPIDYQKQWLSFVEQIDKSKCELKRSISDIGELMKSITQEF